MGEPTLDTVFLTMAMERNHLESIVSTVTGLVLQRRKAHECRLLFVRILFVHEVNWKRKVRFEIHELPERLSLRGHSIDFVDFPEDTNPKGWARILDFRTTVETINSHTVGGSTVRVVTPGRLLPPPLDRLVASLTLIPVLRRLFREHHYTAIVLYGVPTNGWQTVRLARRAGIPVLYRGLDVSHELRQTVFRPLIKMAERSVYRRVNHVSTNNVALKKYCESQGANSARTSVNYPGVDFGHFIPGTGRDEMRRELGLSSSDTVFIYLGTFFRFSGLDRLVTEFAEVRKVQSGAKLLLVGDGELRPELERLVRDGGLTQHVIMTGLVRYEELPRFLATADVALSPFLPGLVSDKALPWKVVQYVTAGLPVVSTRLEGLMGLFNHGEGVVYVDDPSDLWAAAVNLALGKPRAEEVVRRGQVVVRSNCDWEMSITHFENLLESLDQSGGKSR